MMGISSSMISGPTRQFQSSFTGPVTEGMTVENLVLPRVEGTAGGLARGGGGYGRASGLSGIEGQTPALFYFGRLRHVEWSL